MKRSLLAALCSLSLLGMPLLAQDKPASEAGGIAHGETIEDWGDVVIVTADIPGPAIWKVKKGDSEVFILGSMPVMVRHYPWDQARMVRIMDRSNLMITSPQFKGGVFATARAAFGSINPFGRDLYELLPARVSMRFRATVKRYGLDAKKYARMHPIVAATTLKDDVYAKQGLATNLPEKQLIFMARDRKMAQKPMAIYKLNDLVDGINRFSEAEQLTCVVRTLDEIDYASAHAKAATEAWANGDIEGVRAHMPSSSAMTCLSGARATGKAVDNLVNEAMSAINSALEKPGRSVIVLPLSVLLRKGGAFERLKAEGAEVDIPSAAE